MADHAVLITGVAGFIGSTLARALLRDGAHVVGLDDFNDYYDPARKRDNVAELRDDDRFTLCEQDIRDGAAVERIVAEHRPDAIAHLAAYGSVRYSVGRSALYGEVNIMGSVNVLEAARRNDVPHVLFASTSSVYGQCDRAPFVETDPCNEPLAPYPASKKAVEVLGHTYHHLHGMHFTAVRFFNVYGPRGRPDMMPYLVTRRIVREEPIELFDGGRLQRDWTYVDDVIDGVCAAMARPDGYRIINLGRGEPVIMSDFVELIENLTGRSAKLIDKPAPPTEPKLTFASTEKARRLLGYDPKVSLAEGLSRFWAWYREAEG
ncbi:MAG: epimerase [Phycisphaeraceae bacterium]|nr:epimerase [Phycisphaeraceae bacterium]